MNKMKIVFSACMVASLLIGCFPQASQVIRSLPIETKEQIEAQYTPEQIAQGERINTMSCGKCHQLKDPNTRTPEQWNKIVKRMIPRAKLSYDDGKLVRAYLIAHAKEDK